MVSLGTWLHTCMSGKLVGQDAEGNRYYTQRRAPKGQRVRRWVVYHGAVEPTRVPAHWHGWLHYTTDVLPTAEMALVHAWQEPNQPNPTGTSKAYVPAGHALRGSQHAASTADYEPWQPAA
jgi:NADH:ubiquinone oxidoreductase subunit